MYQSCGECGEKFDTRKDLVEAHRANLVMYNHLGQAPDDILKVIVDDFCPNCLHDFWNPPNKEVSNA